MVAVPFRITGPGLENMPGDLGDTRFNNYILEHGYKYLSGEEAAFWNAPFFFPEKDAVTYSDNLLGTMPLYALYRAFGADRETSLQLWFIAMFVLSYFLSWFAFRKITGNALAAIIGAYIFTFSLPIIAQVNHVQLLPRFMIPLVLMWCIQFLRDFRNRDFAFMLLGIVFQFYCGMYLGFLLVLSVLFFVMCASIIMIDFKQVKQLFNLKKIAVLAGCCLLAVLLLFPLIHPYMARADQIGMRSFEEILPTLPRAASYFYTMKGAVMWSMLTNTGDYLPVPWEHYLFPGALALIAAATGAFLYFKNRTSKEHQLTFTLLLTLFLLVIFTIVFKGTSLYKIIMHLPGFGSMRAISRIILIELLFFALIASLVMHHLMIKQKRNRYLPGFIFLFTVADQLVSNDALIRYNKLESQQRIEKIVKKIEQQKKPRHIAFAYMPHDKLPPHIVMLDGMMAGQSAGIPSINGYSSSSPEGFNDFWNTYKPEALLFWLQKRSINPADSVVLMIK